MNSSSQVSTFNSSASIQSQLGKTDEKPEKHSSHRSLESVPVVSYSFRKKIPADFFEDGYRLKDTPFFLYGHHIVKFLEHSLELSFNLIQIIANYYTEEEPGPSARYMLSAFEKYSPLPLNTVSLISDYSAFAEDELSDLEQHSAEEVSSRLLQDGLFQLRLYLEDIIQLPFVLINTIYDYYMEDDYKNTKDLPRFKFPHSLFNIVPVYSIHESKCLYKLPSHGTKQDLRLLKKMCKAAADSYTSCSGSIADYMRLQVATQAIEALIKGEELKIDSKMPAHMILPHKKMGPDPFALLRHLFTTKAFTGHQSGTTPTMTLIDAVQYTTGGSDQGLLNVKNFYFAMQGLVDPEKYLFHLTKEIVAHLYIHVTRLGKEDQISKLNNLNYPHKFVKALEILNIKIAGVEFNGNDGYFVTMNSVNCRKISNLVNNAALLDICYKGARSFNIGWSITAYFHRKESQAYQRKLYDLMNFLVDSDLSKHASKKYLITHFDKLKEEDDRREARFQLVLDELIAKLQPSHSREHTPISSNEMVRGPGKK